MIKHKQRNEYDCGLAASASIMGVDYDATFSPEFQSYIEEKKGTYGPDIDRVFHMVGLQNTDYKHINNYFGQGEENWEKTIRYHVINGLLWGRRALLQLPSLNNVGKSHLVVWYYDGLWDPSNKKTYANLDGVVPEHIWLINER